MKFNINEFTKSISSGNRERIGYIEVKYSNYTIIVTGWTNFVNLENLTHSVALRELNEIKYIFNTFVDQFPEIFNLIGTKNIKFVLDYDDGGGAAGVCEEVDGVVYWIASISSI